MCIRDSIRALLELAQVHADTPVLARTLMQPAQVVSFGFKCVGWATPLVRRRESLRRRAHEALALQFGGAVGTLSSLGARGPAVAARIAQELGLHWPGQAWHTQRDEWVAFGAEVGVLCGALGKIARDWSLLAQSEVGELAEPSGTGRGGSSAMPHKRNPVASMVALAAAARAPHRVAAILAAMPQEHERGLGNWQAELAEWAGLFITAHGAVRALAQAAGGLEVDAPRMRRNIDALHGLVSTEVVALCLAERIGKSAAHTLVESLARRAVQEHRPLKELVAAAVQADPALSGTLDAAELERLFDPVQAAQPAARWVREWLPRLRAQTAQ